MDFAYNIFIVLSATLLQNCWGQDTNSQIPFQIRISPDRSELFFEVGADKVLTCLGTLTEDKQRPVLTWQINDVPVTATDSTKRIRTEGLDNSLMLRVDDVEDEDGGTYKCIGTLGSQTDSRSIKINVIRDLQINSPAKQWGTLGTDGVVACDVTGTPAPTKSWKFKNGTRIVNSDKYIISLEQFTIKNLNFDDTQTYLCDIIVTDTGKSESFYIDYQVVKVPSIELIPIITPNNPKVGDDVTIRCHADGSPEPTYTFERGNTLLPEDQVDEKNGILTIQNLKQEDEADYTCIATNIGGSDKKSNRLDVKIPPIISDIDNVTDAVEGGQIRVTCMAKGDPAPTVTLHKDGSPTYTDGVRDTGPEVTSESGNDREDAEIKTVGKTMYFSSIKPQDAGLYICTAINVVGTATKPFKLDVRYKPHFDTDYKETISYGWKGHTANLTCLASANEVAVFKWYEPNESGPVLIDTRGPYTVTKTEQWPQYHLSSSSLLVFVGEDDSTMFKDYVCEATNSMGSTTRTVTLKRAAPPQNPVVRVFEVWPTKVILELDAPSDNGGQPVKGFQYTYYPSDSVNQKITHDIDSTQQTTSLELKDLSPKTSYVVQVAARNDVGLGTQTTVSFDTKDVSKPLKMAIISPREGPESYSYTVGWDKPDDGGSPITQFNIKFCKVSVSVGDSSQWDVVGYLGTCITETITNPNALSYTINNLERDSYYDIRVTALNKEGESPVEFKIIKTSPGMGKTGEGNMNVANILLLVILACLSALW